MLSGIRKPLGFGFGVGNDADAPVGLDIEGAGARAQSFPGKDAPTYWSGCSNLPVGRSFERPYNPGG